MLGNPAYPTYQVFLAILVSALIAGLVMPLWIRLLKIDGIGQQIRADGPQSHLVKAGTPTMGGVIILLAVCLTCLIMAKPTTELLLAVGAMLATGALGLFDDVTKVVQKRSLGLTPTGKMIGLTAIVLVFFVIAVNFCGVAPVIRFPGGLSIDLGIFTTDCPYPAGISGFRGSISSLCSCCSRVCPTPSTSRTASTDSPAVRS